MLALAIAIMSGGFSALAVWLLSKKASGG